MASDILRYLRLFHAMNTTQYVVLYPISIVQRVLFTAIIGELKQELPIEFGFVQRSRPIPIMGIII